MSPFEFIFRKQKEYFRQRNASASVSERIRDLRILRKWVLAHEDKIAAAVYQDLKKPIPESLLTEIRTIISELNEAISYLSHWSRAKRVRSPLVFFGGRGEISYEPKGVTLIIAPWNFPFLLAVSPLISALAAGCTAVIKPSEYSPPTNALLSEMIREIFVDQKVFLSDGSLETSQALLELPWDHIFFTGSSEVGKKILSAAALNLTSVTLELGGRNPAIVDETADIFDAGRKIAWGKCLNAGQSCVSPNYVFVHRSVYEALLIEIKKSWITFFGGDDKHISPSENMGRIVNQKQFDRIQNLMKDSVGKGAKVFLGGNSDESQLWVSPTILTDVPMDAPVMLEEIFGPILPVIVYDDITTVADWLHEQPTPLAAYFFSRLDERLDSYSRIIRSGTASYNITTIQYSHPGLPFGGVGYSGMGRAHGEAGFRDFSYEKAMYQSSRRIYPLRMLYPPYTKKKIRLIHWVNRFLK